MPAAVIVTHNSQQVLPRCLDALERQTVPVDRVVVVDSGSSDTGYLKPYENSGSIRVVKAGNRGFAAANNLGFEHVPASCPFILFLNPDAFLEPECLSRALETLRQNPEAGVVSGKLFRFDVNTGKPSARLDSTGIFRKWYGRWYDRGQGREDTGKYDRQENDVPAVCGALMFCRREALEEAALKKNVIFDPDFFLYKEDIELCLRLREKGWRLLYQPLCIAWHGRGWKSRRRGMSRELRLMAARSEVMLYRKHPSPYIGWALLKYFLVRVCNV